MKPTRELDNARRTIVKAKRKARDLLKELWTCAEGAEGEVALDAAHFDAGGIDQEKIFCAKCKLTPLQCEHNWIENAQHPP